VREVCEKHGISLEKLAEVAAQPYEQILLLDQFNEARPDVFDDVLTALTFIAKERYSRSNVGNIKFVLFADTTKVKL
jgi:hypothetical protein